MQLPIELHDLANAEGHREVAELVSLSVLEHFPKTESNVARQALCWALNAALERCDRSVMTREIEKRLARGGHGTAERACWLAAAYLVTPDRYRKDLRGMADDQEGLKWLPTFVMAGRFPKYFTRRFAAHDVASFVDAMGAALRPHGVPERSTSDLIGTLGDDPSAAATEALEELSKSVHTEPWEPAIAGAKERQARKRREHEYRHSNIGNVVQTLDGGRPANVGDLAALVFDELKALTHKIPDGGRSDWRQHWNVDRHYRLTEPKPEDACRDAVLSDLQERLGRFGIDAQQEAVYADDKRPNISVSFAGFNVPVEVKRSCHRDVWTAVQSQLIAKYTRNPGAAGCGIHLALWFGDTEKCRPTKCGGWTPETAEGVRLRIQQSLDDREGRLISVWVVDVATPQ